MQKVTFRGAIYFTGAWVRDGKVIPDKFGKVRLSNRDMGMGEFQIFSDPLLIEQMVPVPE
jgi:hypothetical protein